MEIRFDWLTMIDLSTDSSQIENKKNQKKTSAYSLFFRPYQRHILETRLFFSSIPHIENSSNLMKAKDGSTCVYYLEKTVLKKAMSKCSDRLRKMQTTRRILEWIGTTHLVVPKARIFEEYLIEERIPIQNTNEKWQMGFYLTHIEELKKSIQDFALFYFRMEFKDIISYKGDGGIRCDNAPFFIDEDGEYKIALIDLEKVVPATVSCRKVLATLVGFFPYHYELLKETCKTEREDETVLAARTKGFNRFERQYLGHVKFLKNNGIHLGKEEKIPRPSFDLIKEIKTEFIKEFHLQTTSVFDNFFHSFINDLFDEMEADYRPHLQMVGPIKTLYDFLPLRYFDCDICPWESRIGKMKPFTEINFKGGFLCYILNQLKIRQFIYTFEIIPDLFEGTYFINLDF